EDQPTYMFSRFRVLRSRADRSRAAFRSVRSIPFSITSAIPPQGTNRQPLGSSVPQSQSFTFLRSPRSVTARRCRANEVRCGDALPVGEVRRGDRECETGGLDRSGGVPEK